jgi:lipid-A-disaccharide synthase
VKILISAAETSSDAHAAQLLKALRLETDEKVEAFGIGGPMLQAEGLRQIFDSRELLSMGFVEILGRLPKIFSALRKIENEALKFRPDVAVFLDYPDFHFKLAKRLSRLGIPLIYYIPPKVWAWRTGRVRFLKRYFKKILCILPFEEKFYQQHRIKVHYVGNPLQDELPLQITREEARKRLRLSAEDLVLAVLVGSRPAELRRHFNVFLEAAEMTAEKMSRRGILEADQKLRVLVPFAATSSMAELENKVNTWQRGRSQGSRIELRISQGDSALVMRAADVGLIKSGTSTLEAALLGLPHVIAYRPNAFTCFIVKHLIRYTGPIGLSNLVIDSCRAPYLIPELNCAAVTAENVSSELDSLFGKSEKLQQMQETLARIQSEMLRSKESPSRIAAREVLATLREVKQR